MMKNMASSGLTQGLVSALEQKKPWMLGSLAREFNVTERDVALALPEGMCALTSGENFVKVWEGLGHGKRPRSSCSTRGTSWKYPVASLREAWGTDFTT